MRNPSRSSNSHSRASLAARTSPRKSPKQERSQATVQAVLTAAAQVLVRVGYDRANTGLIAEAAGVSVGSVYQYFPNKDAVFRNLLEQGLEDLIAKTVEALAPLAEGTLAEQVRAFVTTLIAFKAENPKLHHVLKTELGRLDGSRIVRRMTERYLELTRAAFAAHQDELRLDDPVRAALLVFGAVDGIVSTLLAQAPALLGEPNLVDDITAIVVAAVESLARDGRTRARS
jgi:AcrR family transcriptional regulator